MSFASVLALLFLPSSAGASEPAEQVLPAPQQTSPAPAAVPNTEAGTSYASQIVLTDVAALALAGIALKADGDIFVSLLPYMVASPIVHFIHGHGDRGGGSFLLHAGLPLVGALMGLVAQSDNSCQRNGDLELCGVRVEGIAAAGLFGMVVATVIDATALAHDDPPPSVSGTTLVPTFAVARAGGGTIGLAATF